MYAKIFFKGIGYYIFSEILCLFLTFSLGLINNMLFRIISIFCCAGIMICLVINFAINCQRDARISGNDNSVITPIITGIAASAAYFILYILLLAAKFGVLPDDFYRIYKLLNAPVINILNFISSDVSISTSGLPELIFMFLLTLIPMAVATITYQLCRKGIIPEDFIFQRK